MAKNVIKGVPALLGDARRALSMNQEQFAAAIGSSKRTVQRWETSRSTVYGHDLAKIAALVYPRDADLAAEIAAAAGGTLESLGIVAPPPPPAPLPAAQAAAPAMPPPPPPMPRHLAVDSIVCAASEALGTLPGAVRGVLLAAFRRSRELGLSCDEVERALEDALRSQAAPAPKAKGDPAAAASPG